VIIVPDACCQQASHSRFGALKEVWMRPPPDRKISRTRLCSAHERRAGEIQRQGFGPMDRVAAPLQVEVAARPAGDLGRPAALDAMGLAVVRALSAPFTAGLRRRGDSLGHCRVKRRAARAGTLHGLRQQGRHPPASKLGGRACRISAVSRIGAAVTRCQSRAVPELSRLNRQGLSLRMRPSRGA
jgi:hypothetical protein